jgi:hypothetical protein
MDMSISTKDDITLELRQNIRLQLGQCKVPHDVVDNMPTAVDADYNFNFRGLVITTFARFVNS